MDTTDPKDLIAHTASLRKLARRLVRDDARAEDVVQETWLAALHRPPQDGANLFGWLAIVARNVARKMGREERRRSEREESVAREDSVPPPEELAEHARDQRELTDLVLALDEPYRTVLLYRYFEDLQPRAIARKLDVPVATVHTRIRRGREQLRRVLDATHGNRGEWSAAFLAWAAQPERALVRPTPPVWEASFATGVGAVLVAGAAALVLFVAFGGSEERDSLDSGRSSATNGVSFSVGEERTEEFERDPPEVDVARSAAPRAHGDVGIGRSAPRAAEVAQAAEREAPDAALDAVVVAAVPGDGPPGLVLVEGGETSIGTSVEAARALIARYPEVANSIAGETPLHVATVEDFYLMPTEVTNEQYAAFVRATDRMPPLAWGSASIEAARRAFLRDRSAGDPAFDDATWWAAHWRGGEWSVPEGRLDAPMTNVTWHGAEEYAAWAGLRLMTEVEFQRAARRDSKNDFPWGDAWDASKCNSSEGGPADAVRVGSFEDGAVGGIHDLVGNVWEWTSTPYTKYEKYKPLAVELEGGERLEALARFDPLARVLAGGGYSAPGHGCRISVRQRAEPTQATEALGFRCAASIEPAPEAARWLLDNGLDRSIVPDDVEFLPERATVVQHWTSEPGTAQVAGYAVITGCERILFCPTNVLAFGANDEPTRSTSTTAPSILGFVSLRAPLESLDVDAGTYYLAWRAAGVASGQDPQSSLPKNIGFDTLVLLDPNGDSAASWQAPPNFDFEVSARFFDELEGDRAAVLHALGY